MKLFITSVLFIWVGGCLPHLIAILPELSFGELDFPSAVRVYLLASALYVEPTWPSDLMAISTLRALMVSFVSLPSSPPPG